MQGFVACVLVAILASVTTVSVKKRRRRMRILTNIGLNKTPHNALPSLLDEKLERLEGVIGSKEDERWLVGAESCADCDSSARIKQLTEKIEQCDIELTALRALHKNIVWVRSRL